MQDYFHPHDHQQCVAEALSKAEAFCQQQKVRLTTIRRRVLELVWQSHQPLGAYQIMAMLSEERPSVAPPTVYRALDFLVHHGLVHKLNTLNAFIGCSRHPETPHTSIFLLCQSCQQIAELSAQSIDPPLQALVAESGFQVQEPVIELAGLCASCQQDAS